MVMQYRKKCNEENMSLLKPRSRNVEAVYQGEHKEGIPHGKGVECTEDDRYEGSWDSGKKSGKGVYITYDGVVYDGEWVEDNQEGYAHISFPGIDNSIFRGDVTKNKLEGYGFFKCAAFTYEGFFKNSARNGEGTLKNPDGKIEYKGNWKNGLRDGYGVRYYLDGSMYKGQFKDNKKYGYGTEIYSNYDKYEGYFENDMRHGEGTYTWMSK
jgi:hypothetical protein